MDNEKWIMDNENRLSKGEKLSVTNYQLSICCSACGTTATRDYAKFCRVCGKSLGEEYQPLDALRASYKFQRQEFQFVEKKETENLFEENNSSTASAFIVYSLVPYLGILFCPGALLLSGFGAVVSFRQTSLVGKRTAIYNVVLSVLICAVQILLWWLLYIVPELGRKV